MSIIVWKENSLRTFRVFEARHFKRSPTESKTESSCSQETTQHRKNPPTKCNYVELIPTEI